MLFLLHQVLLVCADSTSVRITRAKEEQDSFRLPGTFESCSRQNERNRFKANLSPMETIVHVLVHVRRQLRLVLRMDIGSASITKKFA